MGIHVAIIFYNVGGYHSARLGAASNELVKVGGKLTAIEELGGSAEHPWAFDKSELPFQLRTLFQSEIELKKYGVKRKLEGMLNSLDPDVIVIPGWGNRVAKTALSWAKSKKKRTVVMSESKEDDARRTILKELYKSQFYIRKYDSGLVGGRAHRDYLHRLGMSRDRIFLGYDAVDNSYFRKAAAFARSNETLVRENIGSIPDRHYFLSVTRFIPRKNILRLLDAYSQYSREVGTSSAWPLVLCGSGIEESKIMQRISELRLGELVHLPGFVTYSDMPSWYAFAGAFVHPAIQEQWGLVLNEASASGLPILSSETVGSAHELVVDGLNGSTFPPENTNAIVSVLLEIHRLPGDKLSQMGKESESIVAKWGPERFASGLMQAITKASGEV